MGPVARSGPMTYPRAHLVDAENGGFYHCITRCVRRGWLCGEDPISGRSFEHRKGWIESRLLELCSVFSIDLFGYAVMSNHYHVVVEVVPHRARAWGDEEVARRWCRLGSKRSDEHVERKTAELLADRERLDEVRRRLGSLSWFMRYLNEPIARWANHEDDVKGRFWEGRFKSFALLDEPAVVGCMAYVDLNPVRAGVAERPGDAAHSSIARRLRYPETGGAPLASLGDLGLTLEAYCSLLEWTAFGQRGAVGPPPPAAASALSHLCQPAGHWLGRVRSHRRKYRAYGDLGLLRNYAKSLGQRWLCGAKPGLAAPG